MHRDEVEASLMCVPPLDRKLMVGVLASSKTLAGQLDKYPGRTPRVEAIKDIFVRDPRALNLIHYYSEDKGGLSDQLMRLAELGGPELDGFQLNICWPPDRPLFDLLQRFGKRYHVVLQIGQQAMEPYVEDPQALLGKLLRYLGFIDAVLFDPSGGKGTPFDPEIARRHIVFLAERVGYGIGVAGGLGPDTLDLAAPLMREYPWLSIDAEGRLRNPQDDTLNMEATRKYLNTAFAI